MTTKMWIPGIDAYGLFGAVRKELAKGGGEGNLDGSDQTLNSHELRMIYKKGNFHCRSYLIFIVILPKALTKIVNCYYQVTGHKWIRNCNDTSLEYMIPKPKSTGTIVVVNDAWPVYDHIWYCTSCMIVLEWTNNNNNNFLYWLDYV